MKMMKGLYGKILQWKLDIKNTLILTLRALFYNAESFSVLVIDGIIWSMYQ